MSTLSRIGLVLGLVVGTPWSAMPLLCAESSTTLIQSPDTPVALLELYTSEGCSSCPPADAWLSRLKQKKGLWQEFVPVAFHVTYWDYLGWEDRLGFKDYADRQRMLARKGYISSVYTPGLVLNGREWRGWRTSEKIGRGSRQKVGVLRIQSLGDHQYQIQFEAKMQNNWVGHLALLGFGIDSNIQSGENSGRLLKHDFAAVAHEFQALKETDGVFQAEFKLVPQKKIPNERYGVAAWVHTKTDWTPVQATGGYLTSVSN